VTEVPEAFKQLMAQLSDVNMSQIYADVGCTPVELFLDDHKDKKTLQRLDAFLDYVLSHPDRTDKASALWKMLDRYGKFGGVNKPLAFFVEVRTEIARRL